MWVVRIDPGHVYGYLFVLLMGTAITIYKAAVHVPEMTPGDADAMLLVSFIVCLNTGMILMVAGFTWSINQMYPVAAQAKQ